MWFTYAAEYFFSFESRKASMRPAVIAFAGWWIDDEATRFVSHDKLKSRVEGGGVRSDGGVGNGGFRVSSVRVLGPVELGPA